MRNVVLFFSFIFYSISLMAMSPKDAFNELEKGNERFRNNQSTLFSEKNKKRKSLISMQKPFAVIVACADSRVAPEIVFDQSIGDLFVVRVAGNVIGAIEMESIEYAAKYLGSSCVIVMGHQNCGAVNAAIQGQTSDVRFIAQLIKPSVTKAKNTRSRNLLETATKYNAEAMSNFVMQSEIISSLMKEGKIEVKAGYYNFDSGVVEIL